MRGGRYSYRPSHGHRSGLEDTIAAQIKAQGIAEVYEQRQIQYTVPASEHIYTPDFILPNGIIIEAKGLFELSDRKKHLLIKAQYPHLDIRFIFQNPKHKLYKGSTTTYADWCNKHGFEYATKLIPASWFKSRKKDTTGLIVKTKKEK